MDDETRRALDLTPEQLCAMRDAAEPGVVAKRRGRPRDLNQLTAPVIADAIEPPLRPIEVPSDVSAIRITGLTIEPEAERFRVAVSRQAV